MDLAKFLRQRVVLGENEDGQLLFEAFYSYLLPQFEGIDAATGDRLYKALASLMGSAERKERLRRSLNDVLGLELQAPGQPPDDEISGLDEDDDDLDGDQDL